MQINGSTGCGAFGNHPGEAWMDVAPGKRDEAASIYKAEGINATLADPRGGSDQLHVAVGTEDQTAQYLLHKYPSVFLDGGLDAVCMG